ncbi:hypothetical protein [Halorubrum salsamenti]|uniref:hypothetical protein n=1 Tax=Halorubrum salsamenti TaxID=2583990 RepID=UPI0011A3623F|nr:hypothetical protein [Halorubrum salsamenti]
MGGFKEGTVNGWEPDDGDDSGTDSAASVADPDETEPEAPPSEVDSDFESTSQSDRESGSTTAAIPWVLRRNSITDGREQTVQLHLQESTLDVQRKRKTAIENRLGESVRKADLREAALLVGLQETDAVIDVLEEWGYALD